MKKYKDGNYDDGWNTNEDLKRYHEEMIADQKTGELKRLVNCKDEFENNLPVFTSKRGRVIKKYCETYGWPNVTNDGELMYENTFFETYKEAYKSLLGETSMKYTGRLLKDHFRSIWDKIKLMCKILYRDISNYCYARTIQKVKGLIHL